MMIASHMSNLTESTEVEFIAKSFIAANRAKALVPIPY
jgi:hypothetical protein